MHTTEHVPDNDIYFLFPLGVIGFTRVQNLEMLGDLRGKLFSYNLGVCNETLYEIISFLIFHHKGSLDLI